MSSFSLTYPPGFQSNVQTTLDSIMTLEGRNCILYFPPLQSPISNSQSVGAPVGTDISNSVWSAGMPLPFNNQANNVYEGGNKMVEIAQTGMITMVVYANPNKFNDMFPIGERKEEGLIITRGYVKDLEKVLNAVYMETFVDAGTNHYKYKLEGEPVMMGTLIPTRYFYSLWSRLAIFLCFLGHTWIYGSQT